MATAQRARRARIVRDPSRSGAAFDLLPSCAREKSRTREAVCLCRLINGIEETGIERQIGPYCPPGVKNRRTKTIGRRRCQFSVWCKGFILAYLKRDVR